MSDEEIIRRWKSDDEPDDTGTVPPNPAGDQELTDAEMENVAGGEAGGTYQVWTFGCCPDGS